MVLHNLWSISLYVNHHCIIKRSELLSIGLTYFPDLIPRALVDSNPSRTFNMLACLCPWIHIGLLVCQFIYARISLRFQVKLPNNFYDIMIIRLSYICRTMYYDFVGWVLSESFIWYRAHHAYIKIGGRKEEIFLPVLPKQWRIV